MLTWEAVMRLQRMKTLFEANCDQTAADGSCARNEASARVERFGNGSDNKSDFRIILTWDDLEA